MTKTDHGARGPALGYYYQAIYALIQLFSSKNSDAFVSIETLDDVYHEDGNTKNLIQLKHSIQENTKISIKSTQLWKTIKIWCDYLEIYNSTDGVFTLSTVASIDDKSSLNALREKGSKRGILIEELKLEAGYIINKRKEVEKENVKLIANKTKPKPLPYQDKYKGCIAFLELSKTKIDSLINSIHLTTDSFTIDEAKSQVITFINNTIPTNYHNALSESILAWWDREAVRSLTGERTECLHFTELQEFISRKNAELYDDGFTNDLLDMEIPEIISPNLIQQQQLNIISATGSQKRRSYDTEIKARIQRKIWMERSLPAAKKLDMYDKNLIKEWSYEFEEMQERCKEKGALKKNLEVELY